MNRLFPPPDPVRRHAWNAAFVLLRVYRERLTAAEAAEAMDIVQAGSSALGWQDISAMTALSRRVAERRTVFRR